MTSTLLAIALLHWAVLLVPGFNIVLIGQLATVHGRGTALAAVAGLTSATLAWALLAVLGVGVVFGTHPALRQGAQFAGGLYLLWLAWKMARAGAPAEASAPAGLSRAGAWRAGFVTSMLNPKIALFYGSVFATAMPADPPLALIAAAVLLVLANSLVWHVSLALLLSQGRVRRAGWRHLGRLSRWSALVVGAFGLRLLVATLQEWRSRGA